MADTLTMSDTKSNLTAWCAWPAILLLSTSTISTKAAGLLWIFWVLLSVYAYFRLPRIYPHSDLATNWLKAVLLFSLPICAISLYWGDGLQEREEVGRLLFPAIGLVIVSVRIRINHAMQKGLLLALSLASFFALVFVSIYERNTPSNAIPWAVAVSFLSCILIPYSLDSSFSLKYRSFWFAGVLAGNGAVLLSLSRGAYAIVVWTVACYVIVVLGRLYRQGRWRTLATGFFLILCALSALTLTLKQTTTLNNLASVQRIESAINEASDYMQSPVAEQANTSIGVRLAVWRLAWVSFKSSPLIGVGKEERLAKIKAEGLRLKAPALAGIGHAHNEYLQALFDYGLIGLSSLFILVFGLLWLCKTLIHRKLYSPALGLLGVTIMHVIGGLTNMNFAHNYYSLMLSLCVTLLLLFALVQKNPTPP